MSGWNAARTAAALGTSAPAQNNQAAALAQQGQNRANRGNPNRNAQQPRRYVPPNYIRSNPENQRWFDEIAALQSDRAGWQQFMGRVTSLLNNIENTIREAHENETYGSSHEHGYVEQTTVPGSWKRTIIAHASTLWLQRMISYRPRVNDFDFKRTGGRDRLQVNFIRLIEPDSRWSANAHVNVEL